LKRHDQAHDLVIQRKRSANVRERGNVRKGNCPSEGLCLWRVEVAVEHHRIGLKEAPHDSRVFDVELPIDAESVRRNAGIADHSDVRVLHIADHSFEWAIEPNGDDEFHGSAVCESRSHNEGSEHSDHEDLAAHLLRDQIPNRVHFESLKRRKPRRSGALSLVQSSFMSLIFSTQNRESEPWLKAETTSNTWSENPPMLSTEFRSFAT